MESKRNRHRKARPVPFNDDAKKTSPSEAPGKQKEANFSVNNTDSKQPNNATVSITVPIAPDKPSIANNTSFNNTRPGFLVPEAPTAYFNNDKGLGAIFS
jgi:hypothetical protein